MELQELQQVLDREKWLESEKKQHDVCGELPYCKKCDKTENYPCAAAYNVFYAKTSSVAKKPATRKPRAKKVN